MRSIPFTIMLVAIALTGHSQEGSKFHIAGGPSIRIPGINAYTLVEILDDRPFVVTYNSTPVAGGNPLYLTDVGDYYLKINVTGLDDRPFWVSWGMFTLPALSHSIVRTGPNTLGTTATRLCVSSNATALITSVVWKRNGMADGYTSVCRDVTVPGMYTATVTYSFGSESATFTIGAEFINPDSHSPNVVLSRAAYNPVEPPKLVITNDAKFSRFWVYRNEVEIINTGSVVHEFTIHAPGTYRVMGLYNNPVTQISTPDIVIPKEDIPMPWITTSGGSVLKYELPALELTARSGYNAGYTWFLDEKPIEGVVTDRITISKPGSYAVEGCANYPDGSSQCRTSLPLQITGESMLVNSVTTKTALVENTTEASQLQMLPGTQANISSVYADGFARPVQVVQRSASPLGNDIALLHKYDSMGREDRQFLPITRTTNDGAYYYIPTSLKPLIDFYQHENDKIANTSFPFAETLFEASPLNRILKQGSPGEAWQINSSHAKTLAYGTNKASDNIWVWVPSASGLSASSFYPEGSLTVTESTDEDGKLSREFKDKTNQVILTEKMIEGGIRLRIYSVFDDLGRLTHVVPPKTVAALPSSSPVTIGNDVLSRECYTYRYDQRSRVTTRNVPGGGTTLLVYDQWDRIVLTQHANQRTRNKWTFSKYDALNRLVMSGEITLAGDQVAATQAVNTFYNTVSTNPTLRYEASGGTIHGYTNRSFPLLTNELQAYSISYYDEYNFLTSFGTSYQFVPESSLGLTANYPNAQSLLTGLKTAILGTQTYLKTVNFYDRKHRLIQVITDNHLGGVDRSSNALDFTGKIVKVRMVHNGLQAIVVDEEHRYDASGRKLKTFHTVNNGPKILLCDYRYNELGQLLEKNIHSADGETFLQSQDYTYNIRGWLSQVNDPSEPDEHVLYPDQYGFSLLYNSGNGITGFQPCFNGNIAAYSDIRPGGDAGVINTTYSYKYDARNQLTQANYFQTNNNGAFDLPVITYDQNGNIKTLKRKGVTSDPSGLIDDLTYQYNGNQLTDVSDAKHKTKGFIDKP